MNKGAMAVDYSNTSPLASIVSMFQAGEIILQFDPDNRWHRRSIGGCQEFLL